MGFISVWQNFEPTLAIFSRYWQYFYCHKWPNMSHLVTLVVTISIYFNGAQSSEFTKRGSVGGCVSSGGQCLSIKLITQTGRRFTQNLSLSLSVCLSLGHTYPLSLSLFYTLQVGHTKLVVPVLSDETLN